MINSLRSSDAYIHGLVQDWSNSSVLAMELLQFCTKPSICIIKLTSIGSNNGLSPGQHQSII